jgi:hypothetical protein
VCQEEPKGSQRGPEESQREPEGSQKGAKREPKGAKKEPTLIKTSYTRQSSEIVKNGKMNKLTSVKTEDKRIYITAVKV